jgi:hypothetical protein
MQRLNRDAERIAAQFSLSYQSITAERANVQSHYGICYSDGSIRIRLRHATSGRPLKYSSLVNTLCHELAHLRYFNHGVRFQGFYRKLLRWAREEGIYQPRPPARSFRPVLDSGARRLMSAAPASKSPARLGGPGEPAAQAQAEQLSLFG